MFVVAMAGCTLAAAGVARTSEALGGPYNPASRCVAAAFRRLSTGVENAGLTKIPRGAPETSFAALQTRRKMVDLITLNF
jgi:hypothetical protein